MTDQQSFANPRSLIKLTSCSLFTNTDMHVDTLAQSGSFTPATIWTATCECQRDCNSL